MASLALSNTAAPGGHTGREIEPDRHAAALEGDRLATRRRQADMREVENAVRPGGERLIRHDGRDDVRGGRASELQICRAAGAENRGI